MRFEICHFVKKNYLLKKCSSGRSMSIICIDQAHVPRLVKDIHTIAQPELKLNFRTSRAVQVRISSSHPLAASS